MAAQPIYPDELRFELDRLYTRFTTYVDARNDAQAAQMRVDRQEAMARDQVLLKRIEDIEGSIRSLADAILTLTQRVSNLEDTQAATMQLMKDLHAEAMEGINELRQKGKE